MWLDRLAANPTNQALELAARFAEERHNVLAENVANIDTPDYAARKLDPRAFQASLQAALERADHSPAPAAATLNLRGNAQFSTAPGGQVEVKPAIEPVDNVLFHDGTNASIETLMSDAAENELYYQLATNLLKSQYDTLLGAIRGRV